MGASEQDLIDRTRQLMNESGLSWKQAWLRAKAELAPVPAAVSRADMEARTRDLMAERDMGWQDAWLVAEGELAGVEPRKREGCLLGGLRVAFWVVVGFSIYVLWTVLILLAMHPLFPNVVDDLGFLVAIVGMIVGSVGAVLLARRLRAIPVVVMATGVVLVGGALAGFIVFAVASGHQDSIEAGQRRDELVATLERTVSSVSVPSEWEVQFLGASPDSPSVGFMASPDLSSSGTWIVIVVAPNEGEYSEDGYWQALDASLDHENGETLVDEPRSTSLSGVNGYLFELSSLRGAKTGQELGAYVAVFFGPEYTYQVMVQFEVSDRDDMSALYRNIVTHLSLTDVAVRDEV
jgi:hypothetical protein